MLARGMLLRRALVQPLAGRRFFAEALTIPTDAEQQAGRRKEELDAEAAGQVGFNRDPIVPASDAGTKENPIQVRRRIDIWLGWQGVSNFDRARIP